MQILSKADGSVGQLFSNHLQLLALGHVSGTSLQKELFYRETAQNELFWANAINTRDTRLKIHPEGNHFRVNGIKAFGTGYLSPIGECFQRCKRGLKRRDFSLFRKSVMD